MTKLEFRGHSQEPTPSTLIKLPWEIPLRALELENLTMLAGIKIGETRILKDFTVEVPPSTVLPYRHECAATPIRPARTYLIGLTSKGELHVYRSR